MRYGGGQNSITFLGKTFRTSGTSPMTDEEYAHIVEYLYRKPSLDVVDNELYNLAIGGTKTTNIVRYYLIDLIYQTRNREDAWSIEEAVKCKKVLEYFKWKVERSPKTFQDNDLGRSIAAAMRLCGVRCCRKVSNFPIKTMDELLSRYLPSGGSFYDYSCGWAHRMLSSMKNGVEYYGTDPNTELVSRLEAIADRYRDVNGVCKEVHLYSTGSEVLHQDMIEKIDFAFSSPPYFDLEMYKSNNQSIDLYTDYYDWLDRWWMRTIMNIYSYLKPGGVFGLNVKNLKASNTYGHYESRELEKDMTELIDSTDLFEKIEILPLSNIRRPYEYQIDTKSSEEKIFMYRKIL